MHRVLQRVALVAGLLPVALGLAVVPATAATPTGTPAVGRAAVAADRDDFRHVQLPFSGTLVGVTEHINVQGTLDVRVRTAVTNDSVNVHILARLIDTTGIGVTSGGTYRFVGADTFFKEFPPQPVRVTFSPTFLEFPPTPIVPPNPVVPPTPIKFLTLSTSIGGDGAIGAVSLAFNGGDGTT
ncbi:hypothetical protein ACFVXG_21030 [Kitasatospora sp. NPDC058162]|uniref:hypothetical protein n=1 Tax=Kitasatospora sp. NPDC058162 TaxID=3346362 RepID=UPI0036D933AA